MDQASNTQLSNAEEEIQKDIKSEELAEKVTDKEVEKKIVTEDSEAGDLLEKALDDLQSDDGFTAITEEDVHAESLQETAELSENITVDKLGKVPEEIEKVWEDAIREITEEKAKAIEPEVSEIRKEPFYKKIGRLLTASKLKFEDYDITKDGPLVDLSMPAGTAQREVELYPINPPYSYVRITYDTDIHEYMYTVLEPLLSASEKELLENVKERLVESIDISLSETSRTNAEKLLRDEFLQFLRDYSIETSALVREKVIYHIIRDFLNYGKIDAMMRDLDIEDISCDGPKTPVYVYHRKYESIPSIVQFDTDEEADSFVIRMAQICGKHISVANPLLDATMPDGSRIQLTLGREITTRGSTFTIRRFNENPITPAELVDFHTFSNAMMAYMWLAVESSKSIIFSGGTASGKTTAMNAVSMFVQPEMKIVSIEDTRELNLAHPNWIPGVTREAFSGESKGSIEMYELLRAALRQRPEYILVGEVRGSEAYVLFQAMSTGHTTFSTIHADSVQSIVHRLENPPINVPRIMIQALDIVSVQAQVKVGSERVRRSKSITEIVGVDPRTGELLTNEVFVWNAAKDSFQYSGRSYVVESVMENRGWDEARVKLELQQRQDVLEWARRKGISNFKDFSKIVVAYKREPETIMKLVEQDLV
ncbi:flagellar protein FlaI [Methanohalophilus levihalophilus]|uniref:type II/IV secretion system ATPase subunit n=1 Tax=Methanohalophilus levihalophilus TaxID=1431282 RepID=UPI001AE76ACD|nr:ATPase, T2SS/T4P/T4SS family [Methanohalophilus levihalophilus]MBP2029713.1 flagellar protein FlaI [Methanohalophilus levihalophilus]